MLRFRGTLGLVPLAVLFFAALTIEIGKVESDVAARVEAVARDAGAKASVNGRDVSLSAAGLDAAAAERLVAAVLALEGVRQVAGLDIAPASAPVEAPGTPEPVAAPASAIAEAPSATAARPFTFSVERTAAGSGRIRLCAGRRRQGRVHGRLEDGGGAGRRVWLAGACERTAHRRRFSDCRAIHRGSGLAADVGPGERQRRPVFHLRRNARFRRRWLRCAPPSAVFFRAD